MANQDAPLAEGTFGAQQSRASPPITDASFVLVELGKLMSQSDTTTRTLEKLVDKVSKLEDTVKGARIVGTVLIGLVTLLAGGVWWIGAALWPVRQKLIAAILG